MTFITSVILCTNAIADTADLFFPIDKGVKKDPEISASDPYGPNLQYYGLTGLGRQHSLNGMGTQYYNLDGLGTQYRLNGTGTQYYDPYGLGTQYLPDGTGMYFDPNTGLLHFEVIGG